MPCSSAFASWSVCALSRLVLWYASAPRSEVSRSTFHSLLAGGRLLLALPHSLAEHENSQRHKRICNPAPVFISGFEVWIHAFCDSRLDCGLLCRLQNAPHTLQKYHIPSSRKPRRLFCSSLSSTRMPSSTRRISMPWVRRGLALRRLIGRTTRSSRPWKVMCPLSAF